MTNHRNTAKQLAGLIMDADLPARLMAENKSLKETLAAVMQQTEGDLKSAHAEICKLQGLDPGTHSWPRWTPQANTLRWFKEIRERFSVE